MLPGLLYVSFAVTQKSAAAYRLSERISHAIPIGSKEPQKQTDETANKPAEQTDEAAPAQAANEETPHQQAMNRPSKDVKRRCRSRACTKASTKHRAQYQQIDQQQRFAEARTYIAASLDTGVQRCNNSNVSLMLINNENPAS